MKGMEMIEHLEKGLKGTEAELKEAAEKVLDALKTKEATSIDFLKEIWGLFKKEKHE